VSGVNGNLEREGEWQLGMGIIELQNNLILKCIKNYACFLLTLSEPLNGRGIFFSGRIRTKKSEVAPAPKTKLCNCCR